MTAQKLNMAPERNIFERYFLSSEGYYFEYRHDKHDNSIWRVTLYRTKDDSVADDVRVSKSDWNPERDHHDVINYFEARLTLGKIK